MKPEDRNQPPPGPPEETAASQEEAEEMDVVLSSDMERAAAIASVMRDQALKEEALAQVRPPGKKPMLPQLGALALSTALAIYVWFGSPGWLEPDPIPPVPLQIEEDVVRTAVLLQVERIRSYREQNGRLPAFLEEAGPRLPGVEYRRLDSRRFQIHGHGERTTVDYVSGQPLDEFRESLQAVLGGAVGQ